MLPVIILAGVGAWVWRQAQKKKGSGVLTPAGARLHGTLMGQEYDPTKLEKAASLFQRQGLTPQAKDLKGKALQIRKQAEVIPSLCEAARACDQNAMGMIAAIREQAAQGNPRALVSANFIAKYCKSHPPKQLGPLGEVPIPGLPPGWVPAQPVQ